MATTLINFAESSLKQAELHPEQLALVSLGAAGNEAETITFRRLLDRAAAYQHGLRAAGLKAGERVALLIPVSAEYYTLSLALLASGMIVVTVEGELNLLNFWQALRLGQPTTVICHSSLLRWWPLLPPLWRVRLIRADRGELRRVLGKTGSGLEVVGHAPDELALIRLRAGGCPRVSRTHGQLLAQHQAWSASAPSLEGGAELTLFPSTVLHNLSDGVTSVLAPSASVAPAEADLASVSTALTAWQVSGIGCGPGFLLRLARHVQKKYTTLTGMRRIITRGAPLTRQLAALTQKVFPRAEGRALYVLDEAGPVAQLSFADLLSSSEGDGYLAGRPIEPLRVEVRSRSTAGPAASGEVGEISVSGDGELWQSTGDLGRIDEHGRLWLAGRVGEVVSHHGQTVFPYDVEAPAREIRGVVQACLLAHRREQDGELLVELDQEQPDVIIPMLKQLLDGEELGDMPVRCLPRLPSDPHCGTVDRAKLRETIAKGTW